MDHRIAGNTKGKIASSSSIVILTVVLAIHAPVHAAPSASSTWSHLEFHGTLHTILGVINVAASDFDIACTGLDGLGERRAEATKPATKCTCGDTAFGPSATFEGFELGAKEVRDLGFVLERAVKTAAL